MTTFYYNHYHGRFMILMNIIRHKTLDTLKSKHDEQNNQALLKRLTKISVIGAKKTQPPPRTGTAQPTSDDHVDLPPRLLTMDKLNKLINHYQSDPLTWNPSVLGRVFRIPEDYCRSLAIYVRPMIHYNKSLGEGNIKLIKTTFVVDVARLKSDDNYLVTYKRIAFPESQQKLPKKALPEVEDD